MLAKGLDTTGGMGWGDGRTRMEKGKGGGQEVSKEQAS